MDAQHNSVFKTKGYWESRFAVEDEYEWLASFPAVKENLARLLPEPKLDPKILVVGCGNSKFSEQLHDAGWTNITSIDFSAVVIERMSTNPSALARPKMQWIVMDMLTLEGFEDKSFDVVIDKVSQ